MATGSAETGQLPIREKTSDMTPQAPTATFGKALLSEFPFDPDYKNLNHGM